MPSQNKSKSFAIISFKDLPINSVFRLENAWMQKVGHCIAINVKKRYFGGFADIPTQALQIMPMKILVATDSSQLGKKAKQLVVEYIQ